MSEFAVGVPRSGSTSVQSPVVGLFVLRRRTRPAGLTITGTPVGPTPMRVATLFAVVQQLAAVVQARLPLNLLIENPPKADSQPRIQRKPLAPIAMSFAHPGIWFHWPLVACVVDRRKRLPVGPITHG